MAADGGGLEILFEDDAVIGLVKPAGLATANAPRGVPSLFTMLAARRPGGFLGVVSRLDQPVSGVVVLARSKAAAADLARQFRDRTVAKTYLAVVEGRFPAALGTWVEWVDQLPVADEQDRQGPPGQVRRGGPVDGAEEAVSREALLRARVVRRAGEVSLVELCPATGRKHQLRIQLAMRKCPIVGDRRYGARLPFPAGIALHALRLGFRHPVCGESLSLAADPPAAWRQRFPALVPFTAG
jgi:23S rRNA pseudouridine1911/1915/1917 synthase